MNIATQQHVKKIGSLLDSYKNGSISIGTFLNKSRTYIDLIEAETPEKSENLHASWFEIEQAFATALARDEPIDKYENYIEEGINSMKKNLCLLFQNSVKD